MALRTRALSFIFYHQQRTENMYYSFGSSDTSAIFFRGTIINTTRVSFYPLLRGVDFLFLCLAFVNAATSKSILSAKDVVGSGH